jgi:hypothetical protein
LATAKGDTYATLEWLINDTIERAENVSSAELSQPNDELGNQIASLAWVLPAHSQAGGYLAPVGLKEARSSGADDVPLTNYMCGSMSERPSVGWSKGRHASISLQRTRVLVSNMLYRLRTTEHEKADKIASGIRLPHCVRRRPDPQKSTADCDCPQGLCIRASDPFAVKATRAKFFRVLLP